MRTKGKALRDKIDDSIKEIDRLLTVSYIEEDYAKLFKVIGGEVEKYLKSTVFQITTDKKFHKLIDDLIPMGVSRGCVEALHLFREAYNGYKHQPGFSKVIFEAKDVFLKVGIAIDEINAKGLGAVNLPYVQKSKRVVWFAGWDDYMGGMTECNLFIPDYSIDFPLSIEHFNITFNGWDAVISKFTATGDLKMGGQYVSEKAYNVWKANADLMGVGVFTGDIAEFVRELAKYSSPKEHALASFLKRENDAASVRAAIVFSLFDSLRQNNWDNTEDFKVELLTRASYDYGIAIGSAPLIEFAEHIDYNVVQLHREILKNTNDVIWIDQAGFEKGKVRVLSNRLQIAMTANGDLLATVN